MKITIVKDVKVSDLDLLLPNEKLMCQEIWDSMVSSYYICIASVDGENTDAEGETSDENGIDIGYSVCSGYRLDRGKMSIDYVFIKPEYRQKGYGRELLLRTIEFAKQMGCGGIMIPFSNVQLSDEEKCLLSGCDSKECFEYTTIIYSIENLQTSGFANKFAENKVFKMVKGYEDLSTYQKDEYAKKVSKKYTAFHAEDMNMSLCRYFVEDGHVTGSLFMEMSDDEIIYLVDSWIEDGPKAQLALPLMVFSFANMAIESFDKDTAVIFEFRNETNADALAKAFGEPIYRQRMMSWELTVK